MITGSYLPLGFASSDSWPATTTTTSDFLGFDGRFSCRYSLILVEVRDRFLNLDLSILRILGPARKKWKEEGPGKCWYVLCPGVQALR